MQKKIAKRKNSFCIKKEVVTLSPASFAILSVFKINRYILLFKNLRIFIRAIHLAFLQHSRFYVLLQSIYFYVKDQHIQNWDQFGYLVV